MTSSRRKDWIAIQMDTPTNSVIGSVVSDGSETDSGKLPKKLKNRKKRGKRKIRILKIRKRVHLEPSEDDLKLELFLETLKEVADGVLVDCSETIQYFLRFSQDSIHPRWDPEVLRTWPEKLQLEARLLMERRMKAWRRKHPEKEDLDSQDELSFISDEENLAPSEDDLTMEEVEKVKKITKAACHQMDSALLSLVMQVLKHRWNQDQSLKMYDKKLVGEVVQSVVINEGFCWETEALSDEEFELIHKLVSEHYLKMKKQEKRDKKQKKMMMDAREQEYRIAKDKAFRKSKLLMTELSKLFPQPSNPLLPGTPTSMQFSEQLAMTDVVEAMKHHNLTDIEASQHLNPDVSIDFGALGDGVKGMMQIREQSQRSEESVELAKVEQETDSISKSSETSEAPEAPELEDSRIESLIKHPWIQKRIRKDSHGKQTCMTFRYRKFLDEEVRRRPLKSDPLPYGDFKVDEDGYLIATDSTHTVATKASDWNLGSFEDLGVENPEDGTDFDFVPEENAFRYRNYPEEMLEMFERPIYSLYKEKNPRIPRGLNEVQADIWKLSPLRNLKVKLNARVFENIPLTHGQPIELPTSEDDLLDKTGNLLDESGDLSDDSGGLTDFWPEIDLKTRLQKYQEMHRLAHRRRRERRGDSELKDRILEVEEVEEPESMPSSWMVLVDYAKELLFGKDQKKICSRRRQKQPLAISKLLIDLLTEENGNGSLTQVADRLIKRMRLRIIRQQKDLRNQWYLMGLQKRKGKIHTKRYYHRCLYNSWKRTLREGWYDVKVKADLICEMLERDQKPRPTERGRFWDYSNPPVLKKPVKYRDEKLVSRTPKESLMPVSARYPEKFHPRQIFRYSDDQPDIWSDSELSIGSGELDLPRMDSMAHYEPGEVWSQATISSTEGSEDSEDEMEGSEVKMEQLSLRSLSNHSIVSTDSLEYMFPVEVSGSPELLKSPNWEEEKEKLMEAQNLGDGLV